PGHRCPALLDIRVGIGPMDLVQVNGVHLQPPQASLALAANGIGFETVADLAMFVPNKAALAKNVRPLNDTFQGPCHDLLRMAQPVDCRSVDPVDALIQRLADGRNRFAVILRPPSEFPSRSTNGPRPEADPGNQQIRVS